MKYSVGQKVKIRSLEWYLDNVNRYGIIECGKYEFFEPMNEYCGKVVTIKRIDDDNYRIDTDKGAFCWTDEMIEGLVEGESLSQEEFAEQWSKFDINEAYNKILEEKALKQYEVPTGSIKIWDLPEGYQFTDENGNVINATKIVLEKKKKEYPKTYGECCKVLGVEGTWHVYSTEWEEFDKLTPYEKKLDYITSRLKQLLICRDAYWKIAGEEMGLGKPWEPDWLDDDTKKYIITSSKVFETFGGLGYINYILSFPTEEMRDAFYENFKELIESVKELL